MAAVIVDPTKVHEFADAQAFHTWLGHHHDQETEVWIKIHKLASGLGRVIAHFLPALVPACGWMREARRSQ